MASILYVARMYQQNMLHSHPNLSGQQQLDCRNFSQNIALLLLDCQKHQFDKWMPNVKMTHIKKMRQKTQATNCLVPSLDTGPDSSA